MVMMMAITLLSSTALRVGGGGVIMIMEIMLLS